MTPPGWEEDKEEESSWIGGAEDDFGEEESFDEEQEESFLEEEEAFDEEGYEGETEEEVDELQALIDEGEALIEEGEYSQALEIFREAAERFPEDPTALYHIGQTSLVLFSDSVEESPNWRDDDELNGYYEEATNSFEAALSLDEEFYPALNGQGAIYMLLSNTPAAIECWERSLAINNDQEDIEAAVEEARAQLE